MVGCDRTLFWFFACLVIRRFIRFGLAASVYSVVVWSRENFCSFNTTGGDVTV